MKNLISILFVLVTVYSFSQTRIRGTVVDEKGQGISSVHIWLDGTTNGTITNKKGAFFIEVDKFPIHIRVSHLSYISVKMKLESAEDLKKPIALIAMVNTLPTAIVGANRVVDLTEGSWYDISDFEIYQDHILLLAYRWKQKKNPWLIMLNEGGDTLWTSYIGKDGELYKDCLGQIHLVNKKAAYQLFIEESDFQLYPAVSLKDFKEQLEPCIASHDEKIYLEQYTYANQILYYYEADLSDTTYHKIATVVDRRSLRWLDDDAKGKSPLRNEHEKRFEELFFYDPIYAPLIKQGDTTIIFDFVNGQIELYDNEFNIISSAGIDFHKTLKWKEKLFVDEKTSKVYSMFRRGGFHSLHEINLWTGELSQSVNIPQFTFVGKLRVHNSKAFFLYRDRATDQALTKIYRMFID